MSASDHSILKAADEAGRLAHEIAELDSDIKCVDSGSEIVIGGRCITRIDAESVREAIKEDLRKKSDVLMARLRRLVRDDLPADITDDLPF